MEAEEKENPVEDVQELTVDFSSQSIKKIERASNEQQQAVALILDNNEIQRLDNLDSYSCLIKLSLVNNQLIRMYGVSCLVNLEVLDISNNSLVTIEGLKDLRELKVLNLAKNKIKTIEHLNTNLKLEVLDLSENSIAHISDISFLENLKELNLQKNRISYLKSCEKNLPEKLEVLKINNNSVCDLNEISYLANLTLLRELSFAANPCVNFAEEQKRFNYRPFIKNWCSSLITLDNCPLDDIECLKAEWLYSQGRGRSFRPGEHAALIEYLTSVCPKKAEENDEFEDVKKLKLILSKAQQHQQQLREQLSTGKVNSSDISKSHLSRKRSSGIPERMVASFQDPLLKSYRYSPDLMTRSLDSGMLRNSPPLKSVQGNSIEIPLHATSSFIPIPDSLVSPEVCQSKQPLISTPKKPSSFSSRTSCSSSRNSPHSTPEIKRKPFSTLPKRQSESLSPVAGKKSGKTTSRSSTPLRSSSRNTSSPGGQGSSSREKNCRETSEEEDSEVSAFKLVHQKTNKKKSDKKQHSEVKKSSTGEKKSSKGVKSKNLEKELINTKAWKAAVCIQKWWRGYRTRNLNTEVLAACKDLQINRMQDYITKVVSDMEATRIALEGNRKLQVLQMQAINALWKKMSALQPTNAVENIRENKTNLENLVETCSTLNKQVEGLQAMMKSLQESSSPSLLVPTATQTEIVAVHTPQGEEKEIFPYNPKLKANLPVTTQYLNSAVSWDCKNETCIKSHDFTLNLESDSTTSTPKSVLETHSDCTFGDSKEDDTVSESHSQAIRGDKKNLTLKLGETVSSTKDSRHCEENTEYQNKSNS